jgi:mannose/cellobiose epimerase-like protein (N-acyl-D-glucosamine 2-epimerase family)
MSGKRFRESDHTLSFKHSVHEAGLAAGSEIGRRKVPYLKDEAPYEAVEKWLFQQALPFWANNGVDRTFGGFVEQLALDGSNLHAGFKRTRVLGRQIYVFSHAALIGFDGAVEIANHGLAFLTEHAWLGETAGWARRLREDGRVIDPTPDLYDLAFILFAFGWHHRATASEVSREWSLRTLTFIDERMRHPGGKGFWAQKPSSGPRLQNPHMHLLEAALCNLEATGDRRFRRLADELVALFCEHLFDSGRGALPEYFADDLTLLTCEKGRIIEPGHHFEWAWILAWYSRLTGRDMRSWVRALVDFAERYGVARETGATFDLVRSDGLLLDAGERVWPATERIQAAVAMFELDGRDPSQVFCESAGRLLGKHLAHQPAGTWIDHFSATGERKTAVIPASTLYHLMISFTEMLRIGEMLRCRSSDMKRNTEVRSSE